MYKNIDFIYDAIFQLQQLADVVANVDSNRKEYDAVATISNTQFIVIGKTEIRTSNKGLVFGEIYDLKKKTKKPVVAIAKFIASDIARELKEKGINYIDRAGNAYIKHGKLLLYITGQKPESSASLGEFQQQSVCSLQHDIQVFCSCAAFSCARAGIRGCAENITTTRDSMKPMDLIFF